MMSRCPLFLAGLLAAACGGEGPTSATPTTATLTLDFNAIEVIEDCDGIEGDGDFQFEVGVAWNPSRFFSNVAWTNATLGPGGKTAVIGRRTFDVPLTDPAAGYTPMAQVKFRATEYDKNIVGETYNDTRLDDATKIIAHRYNTTTQTWSNLGPQSITLGQSGCLVRLNYTANAG